MNNAYGTVIHIQHVTEPEHTVSLINIHSAHCISSECFIAKEIVISRTFRDPGLINVSNYLSLNL